MDGEEARNRALKLWVVLSRAHAAVQAHAVADITRHALTHAEFAILEALFHKGPLMLGELQRKILVTSGGITYLVDRLEARKLVERRRCDKDRRATYAALTPDGEAMIREIFPAHAAAMQKALDGLDAREQDQAIQLLRTLGQTAARSGT